MKPIKELSNTFFENVLPYPLDHRAGKFNLTTSDYYVLGCEDKFKGIKKAFIEDKPPFYLLHREIFEATKHIFTKLFGFEPDLVTEFYDENKTWNAFIVSHSTFVQYEAQQKPHSVLDVWNKVDVMPEKLFSSFPLIGGINNYGLDKNPAFFYLIGTPFRKSSGSLLTVDNFRFTKDDEKLPFVQDSDRTTALTKLVDIIAGRFEASRSNFDELLDKMAPHEISAPAFAPVVLDLYNRNRSPQSIRYDDTLRHRVKLLYSNAASFTGKQTMIPWTEFIHFVVRYNQFYFDKTAVLESIEELFARKDSYQKFITLFNRFLNDPDSFAPYVEGQIREWERIKDTVLEMPSVSGPIRPQ